MRLSELESIITSMNVGERIQIPEGLTLKKAHGMCATIGNRNNMVFWVFNAPDYILRKK